MDERLDVFSECGLFIISEHDVKVVGQFLLVLGDKGLGQVVDNG